MSNKLLMAIQKLKQKAEAGDAGAKRALSQTLAVAQKQAAAMRRKEELVGMVESGMLDHLLLGEQPQSVEQQIYEKDEIDVADDLMRSQPTSDELANKARLRSLKHDALSQSAAFSRIQPTSVLKGITGNIVDVIGATTVPTGAPSTINTPQVAFWPGEDEETLPVTIMFTPAQDITFPASAADPALRPYGVIQFGSHGVPARLEVDIGLGVQLTVGASQVTLSVGLDSIVGVTPQMRLGGTISFYPIVRTLPVTRTRYADAPNAIAGASLFFSVPSFSGNVVFLPLAPANGYAIDFFDSSNTLVYSTPTLTGPTQVPVALSSDIVMVGLRNVAGGDARGRLVFGLRV